MTIQQKILNSEIRELKAQLKVTPQNSPKQFEIKREIDARQKKLKTILKEKRAESFKQTKENVSMLGSDTARTVKSFGRALRKDAFKPRANISRLKTGFGIQIKGMNATPNELFSKNNSNFQL